MGVSTPNALRPIGLGVISWKLVTWVKDALFFKLYIYILKKREKKREKKNNNPNPRKLTLNIKTEYCFFSNKSPIIYVFIHWGHKKEGLLIFCLRGIEQIYKFNESLFIWID